MEAYKGWVRRNRHWLGSLESLANSLTWLLPDRFAESELAPEALSTVIGLISAINDHIVATAPPEPQAPQSRHGPGAHLPHGGAHQNALPGPGMWGGPQGNQGVGSGGSAAEGERRGDCSVEGTVLALALMKEVEVLGEMAAEHLFGGEENKWGAVAVIEAIKAALRLVLLRHGGQWHMLQDGRTCLHQDQDEGHPKVAVRDPQGGPKAAQRPLPVPPGFPPPPMGGPGLGPGHPSLSPQPSGPLPIHPHAAPSFPGQRPPPMGSPTPPWAASVQGGFWPGHMGPLGSSAPGERRGAPPPGSWVPENASSNFSWPPNGVSPHSAAYTAHANAGDLREVHPGLMQPQPPSAGSISGTPGEDELAGAGTPGNRALQAFLRFQGKLRPAQTPLSLPAMHGEPQLQQDWRGDSQGVAPAAEAKWAPLALSQQPGLEGRGPGGSGPHVQHPAGGGPWPPQDCARFPPPLGPAGHSHGLPWLPLGPGNGPGHAHGAGAVHAQQGPAYMNGGAGSPVQSMAWRDSGAGARGEEEAQEEAGRRQAAQGQALFVLGEVLHVLRPVAYALALRRWGRSSWRPWLISLGLDVSSMALLHAWQMQQHMQRMERRMQQRQGQMLQHPQIGMAPDGGAKEEDAEKGKEVDAELRRRRWLLLLYLLRSPCFDTVTRPPLESVNRGLQRVPLLGSLAARAWDMLLGIQGLYFYTAAS